jgi:hypothetical protein
MPYRFAVHVATTGQEIGRFLTQCGAEMSAQRRSTDELYLEVWQLDRLGKRQKLLSRFAYGKSQPVNGTHICKKMTPL